MEHKLISFLQLFTRIPDRDQKRIAEVFKPMSFGEGEHLFEAGHVCRERFFICSGVLKIVVTNEKGVRVVWYFLKENQFCTILESFTKEAVAHENIVAACPTEVLRVSKADLLALFRELPYLERLIDQITQQALLDKIKIRNTYLGYDSATRYKLFLMQQADVALKVSLSDVASYLGITQQSLSRIRRGLK